MMLNDMQLSPSRQLKQKFKFTQITRYTRSTFLFLKNIFVHTWGCKRLRCGPNTGWCKPADGECPPEKQMTKTDFTHTQTHPGDDLLSPHNDRKWPETMPIIRYSLSWSSGSRVQEEHGTSNPADRCSKTSSGTWKHDSWTCKDISFRMMLPREYLFSPNKSWITLKGILISQFSGQV